VRAVLPGPVRSRPGPGPRPTSMSTREDYRRFSTVSCGMVVVVLVRLFWRDGVIRSSTLFSCGQMRRSFEKPKRMWVTGLLLIIARLTLVLFPALL